MQTNTPAPARYRGPLALDASRCAPINGDTMLNSRPQKLATPHAVPRIGAGYASGVQPYSTELNIDWKKYSMILRPMLDASVLMEENRKSDAPIKADEPTIAHFLPTKGTPYMRAPNNTPGMPQM